MERSVSGVTPAVQPACKDCGMPIPAQRLEAQPRADRCVRCDSERRRAQARPVTR